MRTQLWWIFLVAGWALPVWWVMGWAVRLWRREGAVWDAAPTAECAGLLAFGKTSDALRIELRNAPIAVLKLREYARVVGQLRRELSFERGRYAALADSVLRGGESGYMAMLEKANEAGKKAAEREKDTNILDSRDETGGRG